MKSPAVYFFSLLLLLGVTAPGHSVSILPPPVPHMRSDRGTTSGKPAFAPGRVLVKMKPGASADALIAELGLGRIKTLPVLDVEVLSVPEGAEESTARLLGARPDVLYAEPDGMSYALLIPNDPYYAGYQWYLPKINAPKAWDYTTGSGSVVVAVVDTGIDATHPELKDKILPGYNAITGTNTPTDDEGHGTFVSGIIAMASNNSAGMAGICWGAKILPVKALNSNGSGTDSDIAEAVRWAADHGAKVINMSLGGPYSQTEASAVAYAANKGCLILAAMGNEYMDTTNPNPKEYPAGYTQVMAVGATNNSDQRSDYSNTGAHISVSAPGGETTSDPDNDITHYIFSTFPVSMGNFVGATGTSAATPVVAGVAALVWSAAPTYTAAQVRQVIEQTATDIGSPGFDNETGYGRVDAGAALAKVVGTAPVTDTTAPTAVLTGPTAGQVVAGTVTVTGTATDDRALQSYQLQYGTGTNPVSWVNIGAAKTQPVTQGVLGTWNTTSVGDGKYTLRVTASDVTGNKTTSNLVTVTVSNVVVNLTMKLGATLAKTGANVGVTVTSSQPLSNPPTVTATGACVSPSDVPLSGTGPSTFAGTFTVPDGTSDCTATLTASGTDAAGKATGTASATLRLDLTPPAAKGQAVQTSEDQRVTLTLSATDTSPVTYAVVDGPSHGTLGAVSGAQVTYTPAADYNGPDSFTFKANDGTWDSAPATVSLTVAPVNDAPIAANGGAQTLKNKPVPVALAGTDVDGDALTYTVLTPPAHGTLSGVSPDFVYTPATDYVGSDSFSFTAADGTLTSAVATETVNVIAPLVVVTSGSATPGGVTTLSISLTDSAANVTGLDLTLAPTSPNDPTDAVGTPTFVLGDQAGGWDFFKDPNNPFHFTMVGPALSGPAEMAKLVIQTPLTLPVGTYFDVNASSATLTQGGAASTDVAALVEGGRLTIEGAGPRLKGDGTGDGAVDVADAVLALQTVVGVADPDAVSRAAADVDCSGGVTVDDAVGILKNVVIGTPFACG